MSDLRNKFIIEELLRRKQASKTTEDSKIFKFEDYCFDKQKLFFRSEGARFRASVCSRRSGKSQGIAADMIDTCLYNPDVVCLYLTLSKRNARNIIWTIIERIIKDYNIQCTPNQVDMSVKFPNGSKINIEGVKDRTEIEKYRGWKLLKCYIDEAQSFRPYVRDLVNDIITPALRDLRGSLYLTGTPGPVPAGYLYECAHNPIWQNFHWTAFDNPHMHNPPHKDLAVTLSEERQLKGITELDPSYRRETYGEWIEDVDSLVYKYSESVNDYTVLPKADYVYIMGVDIGYDDSDAICVLAYSKEHNKVYLVEEFIKNKQTISELAEAIKEIDAHYHCIKKVIDAGALGKKITEEINQRWQLYLEPADKNRKIEYIELMNSDLRNGTLKIKKSSVFAEDSKLVQWDRDKSNPNKLVISDVYHTDIGDSVLYAYREARHYLYAPEPQKNIIGTNEYMKEMEDLEAQRMEDSKKENEIFGLTNEEMLSYENLMFKDEL